MAKLKSLRAAVGSYGRVSANGIVEVDEATAKRLRKTKRFVDATEEDVKAAQQAQKALMAVQVKGIAPGFSPLPEAPKADRLAAMIREGQISPDDARRLAALQIELAPEEVRALIQGDIDRATAQLADLKTALDTREQELDARVADLDARELALADRETLEVAAPSTEDADKGETGAADTPPAQSAPEAKAEADAKAKADGGKKTGK